MNQLRFTQISHSLVYDTNNKAIIEKLLGLDPSGQVWKYDFETNTFYRVIQVYEDNSEMDSLQDIVVLEQPISDITNQTTVNTIQTLPSQN